MKFVGELVAGIDTMRGVDLSPLTGEFFK